VVPVGALKKRLKIKMPIYRRHSMQHNPFGKSELFVSKLCLGTMTFGVKGFWEVIGKQSQETASRHVDCRLDVGINFIDAANVYSFGESERLLNDSLCYPS
jgi:aryl-alcohol dehydrogenase-like predicted oxidoreductase